MAPEAVLDHVSVAVASTRDAWPLLRDALGGSWLGTGDAPGFRYTTLRYANGMCLELLEPFRTEENDFLHRFLKRHGPGLHHLTFRVPSIFEAVERVTAAGWPVHSMRTDTSDWHEAFLHPHTVGGPVVQLAEYTPAEPALPSNESAPTCRQPAALRMVEVTVDDVGRARELFAGLLGGHIVEQPAPESQTDVLDVRWADTGTTLRLRAARPDFRLTASRITFTMSAASAYRPGHQYRIPVHDEVLGVDIVLVREDC